MSEKFQCRAGLCPTSFFPGKRPWERGWALSSAVFENFEVIVGERVQVNLDNSRAMSVVTFFIIQIEYTAQRNNALKLI